MNYRETVDCPVCGATPGEPCEFTEPQPLKPDGTRPVHAARYAMTLPESERGQFWEGRIEAYLSARIAEIDEGSNGGE